MIVFVDVDSVCADLEPVWLDRYNRDYDDALTPDKLQGWAIDQQVKPECGNKIYQYLEDPALYDDVKPVPYSLGGVGEIRELGHRVIFATSSPNGSAGRKLRWLLEQGFLSEKQLRGSTHPDYIEIHDKSLLHGDVLIDDGPHNVQNFHGYSILFRAAHNRGFDWPVAANGWNEVVELISVPNIPPGTHITELRRPVQARAFRETINAMYQVHLNKNADYCVDPDTRVLTDDLLWVPIRGIKEGMTLVGFDEYAQLGNERRMYRPAIVESVRQVNWPSYKLTLEDGTELISSAEHPWLVQCGSTSKWVLTKDLQHAEVYSSPSRLVRAMDTWESDSSYESGYLAAALDGEGWLSQTPNHRHGGGNCFRLGFAQEARIKENPMMKAVQQILDKRGMKYIIHAANGQSSCDQIRLVDTPKVDVIRLLGEIRPCRLIANLDLNFGMMNLYPVRLIKKEPIGEHDLVGIKTSTKTYLAEGFASHNSPANILGPGELGLMTRTWDKVSRLMNLMGFRIEISASSFTMPEKPKCESIDDSVMDMTVYGIIWQLYRKGAWGK